MLGIKKGKLLFAASLVLCSLFACNAPPPFEIDCEDGIDDDQNGLVDCEDSACLNTFECTEFCEDGVDNDRNNLIDCEDPQCEQEDICIPPEPEPEQCLNGVDDDLDGLEDCEDLDDCRLVSECHCQGGTPLFFDGETELVITGDTTGAPDIALHTCQENDGAGEVLFVVEPLVNTDVRVFLESEDGAELILDMQQGLCDDRNGSAFACAFDFQVDNEGLGFDVEVGSPFLLFVGGKDITQNGRFTLRIAPD